MRSGAHLSQVPARTDWATPWPLFAQYAAEFGFTLDVCATQGNTKCTRYFTPDDNGLTQCWADEICWMNPPFGKDIPRWMEKAYFESQHNRATVVALVPARTCTAWWHDYAEKASERRFIRGRIKFEGTQHNAPFPCAIVVFRPIEDSSSAPDRGWKK